MENELKWLKGYLRFLIDNCLEINGRIVIDVKGRIAELEEVTQKQSIKSCGKSFNYHLALYGYESFKANCGDIVENTKELILCPECRKAGEKE